MDEEEEGLFSSCFRDLKVNAELARAVARELQVWIASCADARSAQFTCFTSTKVQILTPVARELQVWIASCADARSVLRGLTRYIPECLLALLVQKYLIY